MATWAIRKCWNFGVENRVNLRRGKEKIGSSGRTRTKKSLRKHRAFGNLLKLLKRTILRFRAFRLLRGKLVRKVAQAGTA